MCADAAEIASDGANVGTKMLQEFKDLEETPVLVLLLETFQKLPVTMEMLKSTTSAKMIKNLSKHGQEGM